MTSADEEVADMASNDQNVLANVIIDQKCEFGDHLPCFRNI